MRSQTIWTQPAPPPPAQMARICARRAMAAHKARQSGAARFWLERAETFHSQGAERPL